MPTNQPPTLALALDGNPLREQLAGLAKSCIELDTKAMIGAALSPRFWSGVGHELGVAVMKQVGETSISKILVEGWLSAKKFREYADPIVHPPGERNVAALGKHSVRSPHKVAVELVVNGKKTSSMSIELVVQFDLEAARIHILDGRIGAIAPGIVAVSITLKHAGKELKRVPLRELRLDGQFPLHPPVPIMLPDRYPPAVALPADARVPSITPLRAD